ncbi:MAG TPA: site-2 protease family protein [Candidatus Acidoferrales bacterium]|nr:site-2 protease family protein [Candidatus Acidoferrales bacterium]
MENIQEVIAHFFLMALPILAAIVFHEVSHGWVANRLGDPTAARMGRLTLNPIPHIDPFGTILLPLVLYIANAPFLFGYARPVPVNFYNLNRPKRDMIWVALAGPLTNVLLAAASALFLKLLLGAAAHQDGGFVASFLLRPLALMAQFSVIINVGLAVFNIVPIPPLDGGRVLVGLLPEPHASTLARVEPFGFLIIIVLLMTDVLDRFTGPAMRFLLEMLSRL